MQTWWILSSLLTLELSWFSPCTIHVRVESLKTFEMPPDEFGMRCKKEGGSAARQTDRPTENAQRSSGIGLLFSSDGLNKLSKRFAGSIQRGEATDTLKNEPHMNVNLHSLRFMDCADFIPELLLCIFVLSKALRKVFAQRWSQFRASSHSLWHTHPDADDGDILVDRAKYHGYQISSVMILHNTIYSRTTQFRLFMNNIKT